MLAGAAAGIMRSAPPKLFSLVTGAQWFTLGFGYYGGRCHVQAQRFRLTISTGSRLVAFKVMGADTQPLSSSQKIRVSALAGGVAGILGGLLSMCCSYHLRESSRPYLTASRGAKKHSSWLCVLVRLWSGRSGRCQSHPRQKTESDGRRQGILAF